MTLLLSVVTILVLIVIGVPIAYAFCVGSVIALAEFGELIDVPSVAYNTIDSFPLMAIPFFLLSGVLMRHGGVSRRLIDFVGLIVGWLKGAMGATMVVASGLFGAISGSSVATVSAMGTTMTPEMVRRGYPRGYVGGIASVSGILGILIPPSIPMVVYGISASVSVGDMFVAGIGPGVVLLLFLLVVNYVWAFGRNDLNDKGSQAEYEMQRVGSGSSGQVSSTIPSNESDFDSDNRQLRFAVTGGFRPIFKGFRAFTRAVPALLMPVIILGGIYGGIFTPTEAGAVACFYALFVGLFIYREIRFREFGSTMLDGMLATAPILLIIAFGGAFSRALTLSGLPMEAASWIADIDLGKIGFVIVLNIFLLLVGCFVEENTAIIVLAPILLPITSTFGMDPIHVGVIMVLNLGLGLATPPMAPNAFIAAKACDVPFHRLVGTNIKFLVFAGLPSLVLINAFPILSLWFK